jgi:hypothetical protein
MNPETIALQDEGLRENSEQTLQTFTPEKAAKKRLRVKEGARTRKPNATAATPIRDLAASIVAERVSNTRGKGSQ